MKKKDKDFLLPYLKGLFLMPKHTPSWTTSDGQIHTDYIKSLRHELMFWFKQTGDNEVGARKIVENLNLKTIDFLLENLTILKAELTQPTQFTVVNVSHKVKEAPRIEKPEDLHLVPVPPAISSMKK